MAQVSGQGTIWNLPNYSGMLYTADAIRTPFFSNMGMPTRKTGNFEFPTASLYDHSAAAQPAITETASLTAPTATEAIRTQEKNVTEIHQKAVKLSYVKQSNSARLSGINTAGATNNAVSEMDFQRFVKIQEMARDIEYSFLNGAYQISTSAAVANKTRGMFELCASTTTVNAAGAAISKVLINSLLKSMADAGAYFNDMFMFVNSFNKQGITDIYEYVPTDRNIGGANIQMIETDFGPISVVYNRFVPAASLGIFDMSAVGAVEQDVNGKGNFFEEPLTKSGASDDVMIFGQIGLDHGPGFMHGSITSLATS